MSMALLILAIPLTASAQVYNRNYDRYDRVDRRDVRDAINRLDNSAVQLERDLNTGRQRRVLGGLLSFSTVDNDAIAEVRNFRAAVGLVASPIDFGLDGSHFLVGDDQEIT